LQGVRDEAGRRSVAMGAAVVDLGGRVVAALRMDGAQVPALDLAIDKAFTAVSFDFPTEFWASSTRPDGSDWGCRPRWAGASSSSPAACRSGRAARWPAGSA
jgi:uncharacterized protein GlcG (DUF336 family)